MNTIGSARRRGRGSPAIWAEAVGGGRLSWSAGRMPGPTSAGCRGRPAGPIGCPRKPNGNMPAGPARRAVTRSARRSHPRTPITIRRWAAPVRSAPIRRTPGVSTTCTAMHGSGSRMTGMKATGEHRATGRRGRALAYPRICAVGCCAPAPGRPDPGPAGPPSVTRPPSTLGTSLSGSE